MKLTRTFKESPDLLMVVLLCVWFALNMVQAANTGLGNNELYYWYVSQSPEWGYFDHPPLFGLLTWAGTQIGGSGALWIRFGAVLLQPLALYLLWTLVRTPRSTWRSALRFAAVAFALPLLQLFGFIDSPAAPLFFFTAATLWSYRRYCRTQNPENNARWMQQGVGIALLGISVAGMIYSSYLGAAVLLCVVGSRPRLLRASSFWIAVAIAAGLLVPHFLWLVGHEWATWRYHIFDCSLPFIWSYIWGYLLNLLVLLNPLFVPFFLAYVVRSRKKNDPTERAFKSLAVGLTLLLAALTLRGPVEPEWYLLLSLPLIYFLCRAAESRPAASGYLLFAGCVSALLLIGTRVFIMTYSGHDIALGIFNNQAEARTLYDEIDGRVLITDDSRRAAAYTYYTGADSYSAPSTNARRSQFEFIGDEPLYHSPAAVEISPEILDSLGSGERKNRFLWSVPTPVSELFYYDTVACYLPTRRIEIRYTPNLPDKVLTGQILPLAMTIVNPYPYDLPFNPKEFRIVAQFRYRSEIQQNVWLKLEPHLSVLPANSTTRVKSSVIVPERLPSHTYTFGISVQRYPFTSWCNSRREPIQIVNPKRSL